MKLDPTILEEHTVRTGDESDRWGDSIVLSVTDNSLKKMPRLLTKNEEEGSLQGLKIMDNSGITSEAMIIFPQENESMTLEPVPGKQ